MGEAMKPRPPDRQHGDRARRVSTGQRSAPKGGRGGGGPGDGGRAHDWYARHHPLRWRPLTWLLIDVDAFGVGFLVGLAVGYRRLSPLGSDAEEGVSMLVFFAIAGMLLLNVVIALSVSITQLLMRHRRSTTRSAHRLIWLPAPIALVLAGLFGNHLMFSWYAEERISEGPSLQVWRQLPSDSDGLGGDGDQVVNDVILSGARMVAVGSDGVVGTQDAAVWQAVGRTAWTRIRQDAFGGRGAQVMTDIAIGPSGLVAVGYEERGGDVDAAAWTTTDGRTWSRVPDDERILGGDGDQIVNGLESAGGRLVAVGSTGTGSNERAAVWISTDGAAWSRIDEHDMSGGTARTSMTSIDAGGSLIVAAGSGDSGDHAPIWTSTDGLTWSRVPDRSHVFAGARLSDVAVDGPDVVAVGNIGSDAAVWMSTRDGASWSRVPHDEFVFGGYAASRMNDVMFAGDAIVAGGATSWPTSPVGEVWISIDRATWSRVAHAGPMTSGSINAVTGVGERLVGVGAVFTQTSGRDGSVWITVRAVG